MKIQGKTVLITGAAQRIGREIAMALAKRGARLALHYNTSAVEVEILQEEIQRLGEEAFIFKADFSENFSAEALARELTDKVLAGTGSLDVLINNASVFYKTPLEDVSDSEWDHFHRVNLKVPFFLARAAGLEMRRSGAGKIINIIDAGILHPDPAYVPYTISKSGLHAATIALAKALAPEVEVNSIAPGPILPPAGAPEDHRETVASQTLLKRYGAPEDIVAAVRFLIEGTDYLTGTLIPIDGGRSLV